MYSGFSSRLQFISRWQMKRFVITVVSLWSHGKLITKTLHRGVNALVGRRGLPCRILHYVSNCITNGLLLEHDIENGFLQDLILKIKQSTFDANNFYNLC